MKKLRFQGLNRYKFRIFIPCLTHHKDNNKYEKTLFGLRKEFDVYLLKFNELFKTKTKSVAATAKSYLTGLFVSHLANIESISESVDSKHYHQLHHFISNSNWGHTKILDQVSRQVSNHFNPNKETCLIIDESGNKKKGRHSVGVAKQYCGNLGKIDTCQVAVYGALCQGEFSALVDSRLYLPKEWCDDDIRCEKVKIPLEHREFKTKIEIALSIIERQIDLEVKFDYVLMDAFYGRDHQLTQKIHELGKYFIGDIRNNQVIYLEKPDLILKPKKGIRGRKPTILIPDKQGVKVKDYISDLKVRDYRKLSIRNTSKGKLKVKAHAQKIWIYDDQNEIFLERTLVIRKNLNKNASSDINYFFTNMSLQKFRLKQIIAKHATRYFIEHNFKEAKSCLGMSQFQTRKWRSWQHQTALILLLLSFIMIQKIKAFSLFPIMSANDIKILLRSLFSTRIDYEKTLKIFYKRYYLRQFDVNLVYSSP